MYERRQAQNNKTMTRRLKHYSLFARETHTHTRTPFEYNIPPFGLRNNFH